jgi:hypothetical protein
MRDDVIEPLAELSSDLWHLTLSVPPEMSARTRSTLEPIVKMEPQMRAVVAVMRYVSVAQETEQHVMHEMTLTILPSLRAACDDIQNRVYHDSGSDPITKQVQACVERATGGDLAAQERLRQWRKWLGVSAIVERSRSLTWLAEVEEQLPQAATGDHHPPKDDGVPADAPATTLHHDHG